MGKPVIGWPRWTQTATFDAWTGSWAADWPVANLGVHDPLPRVARTTGTATAQTRFSLTLPVARPVRLLALVGHNLTVNGRWRATFWGDAGRTLPLGQLAWMEAWPAAIPSRSMVWEDPRWWTGRPDAEELAGYTAVAPWFAATATPAVRRIDVEIDDTGNTAGFVQVALFEVALGYQPTFNFSWGAALGWESRTQGDAALGGGMSFDRRPKPRVFEGEIKHLPTDELMGNVFEAHRAADLDLPFLFWLDPDDAINQARGCFLARFAELGLLPTTSYRRGTAPVRLREVL